jgi:hypothetical protein
METNQAATQPGQETAAPVETDSAPVAETETTQQPVAEPKKDSEPEWFTKRFGEITAKYRETERRALAAEQRAAQLEQERLKAAAPEKPKTLADFNYDEVAFQGYVVEQARKAAREAASEADSQRQREIAAERRNRKFQERAVAFEKDNPDYRDVAHYAPISDELAEVIQDMESGPEIAYYLGKNRDVALSLSDLPPHIAAIELGRIDARLTAERQAKQAALEKAKAEKAVSGAPPPTPKLEGAGNAGTVKADDPDSDNLSDAEWARRRNKQVAKQRGT